MPSTKLKSSESEIVANCQSEGFNLTDKVKYEDFVQITIPESIIFPEELNRFLRDRIRELTAENGSLRRSLDETEEKFSAYRKSVSQTGEANSQPAILQSGLLGKSGEIATTKIVELSKKCREQTAEIEVLKSKCKKLEAKLEEINKNDNNETEEKKSSVNCADGIESRPLTIEDELKSREEENRMLTDRVQQANAKLYESKNACTLLRQELNKAQKLLCREVGENVTIASLSSSQSGWKGRAEQIQHLQNKLAEYEGSSNAGKGSTVTLLEKRNLTNLRNIEKERRQKAEDAAKELSRIIVELEASKRKQDAAKARVKVLENDLATAKQSILLLNEKRSHDDQLIQALNGQLRSVEDKFRDREREITRLKDRAENECVKFCSEFNRLKSDNENLKRMIEERETEIDALRNGTTILSAKENTNKHYASSSREKSRENCRCSNGDYNEYVTLGIAAEAERERLLELVIVLNRRLEDERFATDKIEETLRGERMKLAKLETKLQRLEMERVGMSRISTGYKPRSSKSTLFSTSGGEGDGAKDEMRFRLELLEEECLALKTRLATVQRDKASDLAMYKQMLDQARKTFQDAYRGKSNSSSYSTVTI